MNNDEAMDLAARAVKHAKEGEGKLDYEINRRCLQELRWYWNSPDQEIFETVFHEYKGRRKDLAELKVEIWHNITSGRPYLARVHGWEWNGKRFEADTSPRPQRVEVDQRLQQHLLRECAAPGLDGVKVRPLEALQRIYGQELVCVGQDKSKAKTAELAGHVYKGSERWLRRYQFIVPNPMSKSMGRTKDGRWSYRTLDNVKERRHLVVEFDGDLAFEFDEQLRLLWHLGERRPLVMIVHSGNKSLHGWFDVRGIPESEMMEFFNYAERIGADHEMWSMCQFTRIPGGVNQKTGKDQKLMYFNL
jgi:hypothetical protein